MFFFRFFVSLEEKTNFIIINRLSFLLFSSENELDTTEYNDHKMYEKMMLLKKHNTKLKILLSVGGYTHEDEAESKYKLINIPFCGATSYENDYLFATKIDISVY